MSKIIKRIAILAGIFLVAVGVYFITSLNTMEQSETVYTSMEEPTLPVVYTDLFETERNRLVGYCREMDTDVAREVLTVLPEDRQLKMYFAGYGVSPLKISYEIRSLDLERLVEKTQIDTWEAAGDEIEAILPIQNLLTKGSEYLLHLMVETEPHGVVHYYTRILWPENDYGPTMAAFAREFSEKSLSAEQAQELVTYLETTDTADNSSLGHVTIKSSFSQLTWAGLKMELVGQMQVNLRELNGIMGQAEVRYQVKRLSENGETEVYDVRDYYTMKWGEKRIYLMDFDRKTNQVFSGERDLYSGKRILLGIGSDDTVQVVKSANKQYIAFVFNRDLWCYDQEEEQAVKVFSFRSRQDASRRSDYDHHGIRILSMKDNGDMDFLVYGYMNRGVHEGYQGVSLCSYSHDGAIEERFFVSSSNDFDEIKQDVEKLSYFSESGMLYLYQNHAVFSIDLSSKEYMVVADGLMEGCYAISADKSRLAWQEGTSPYESTSIHVFDMATGLKQEIKASEGSVLRTLGFVQGDFVYGLARTEDLWIMNGRQEELPMYGVEIVDRDLNVQTRYEKNGYYVSNVAVEDARIHMDRLVKLGSHEYVYHDSDTIVCNAPVDEVHMEGIGWFASEIRRKVYFVQLDQELNSRQTVKVTVSRKISYDQSEELELKSGNQAKETIFYAYGQGKLLGAYTDFAQAVKAAYDAMGIVTDFDQRILWDRVNRSNIRTVREPQTLASALLNGIDGLEESSVGNGLMILDARGCTLNQILYFIGQGCPVIGYTEGGNYLILYAYDQYNITALNPLTGESMKMGLNDSAEYFSRYGNDFVCGILLEE